MSLSTRVAVLVTSLGADSTQRHLARALVARAPSALHCDVIELDEAAFDLSATEAPKLRPQLRSRLEAAEALLLVTPELNGPLPTYLETALDGLPTAVLSLAPQGPRTFGANHSLRQDLVFRNFHVMEQPEACTNYSGRLFDGDGDVPDTAVAVLECFMVSFELWVNRIREGARTVEFAAFLRNRHRVAHDFVNGDTVVCSR